jgi:hypothetical protein
LHFEDVPVKFFLVAIYYHTKRPGALQFDFSCCFCLDIAAAVQPTSPAGADSSVLQPEKNTKPSAKIPSRPATVASTSAAFEEKASRHVGVLQT